MPLPLIPIAMMAGSALFNHLNNKHKEKEQYNAEKFQAEQDFNARLKQYEAAMQQFEVRQSMLKKYLADNQELSSVAPKEYMDALNKNYRSPTAPVFQFRPFGSSSSGLNTFLSTGLNTAAQLWPSTPQKPYSNPTSQGMGSGGLNMGTSVFKPTDFMGSYKS